MLNIDNTSPKKIFITGATSGIGFQATLRLLKDGHEVIIPCRNKDTKYNTYSKLKEQKDLNIDIDLNATFPIMDLSDLNSIKICCNQMINDQQEIDTLILNAGLQYTGASSPKFSVQGYELTFAINHLSHHYLTYLLLPLLYKSKSPRIVITSSEVHNPNSAGGQVGKPASLDNLKGFSSSEGFTMLDGSLVFNADKAYKDTKLCNILFAKALIDKFKERKLNIPVITWAPGLVIPKGREGFFKYSRTYNELGQVLFAFIARDLTRISVSPIQAGLLLRELATDDKYKDLSFKYYSNKTIGFNRSKMLESSVSEEAQTSGLPQKLWDSCCKLLNINNEIP